MNAFVGNRLRLIITEPDPSGEFQLYIEMVGRDKHWRRLGSVPGSEFQEFGELFVQAYNFAFGKSRLTLKLK